MFGFGSQQQTGNVRYRTYSGCSNHIHLGVEELLNGEEMVRLPLVGIIRHNLQVERLEGVLLIDRHLAQQALHPNQTKNNYFFCKVGFIFKVNDALFPDTIPQQ
jgi:hypothetical protein